MASARKERDFIVKERVVESGWAFGSIVGFPYVVSLSACTVGLYWVEFAMGQRPLHYKAWRRRCQMFVMHYTCAIHPAPLFGLYHYF
jgi:hypothetical protein